MSKFYEWVNRKEAGINHELVHKHFKFKRPSDMLKVVYTTNDKQKNNKLVNVIKSGLNDLNWRHGWRRKRIEKANEIIDVVEKFLSLTNKSEKEKD